LTEQDLHGDRPAVYLDQWVWVRLAKAAQNEPRDPRDLDVLAAVRRASEAGVAFPLSATHYQEVGAIGSERQRADMAATMASISFCRTLRSRAALLRHQMLMAMHIQFGRPAFRPSSPDILGIGAGWALAGTPTPLQVVESGRPVAPSPKLVDFMRRGHQGAELRILEGARANELNELRQRGYKPEAHQSVVRSRLEWEEIYADLLARDDPISREELRVRVQARELIHEHLEMFSGLLREYRLDLHQALGSDPTLPGSGRSKIVAFADAIPSLRVATDLKVELFRDTSKSWDRNSLYDVDALSMALPYCEVVVPDKQMANLLSRSRAGERNNTVVASLFELPAMLAPLVAKVRTLAGDVTGWDELYPGSGWDPLDLDDVGANLIKRWRS
jgi:hypothetical protein